MQIFLSDNANRVPVSVESNSRDFLIVFWCGQNDSIQVIALIFRLRHSWPNTIVFSQ